MDPFSSLLTQLAASRRDLLQLMDYLVAGMESANVHVLLVPAFGRLYRRIVAIMEEEKVVLEKMDHPNRQEREEIYNRLAKQVVAQYRSFKAAPSVDEQKTIATAVIETINGFTVQNFILWDQITLELHRSVQAEDAAELAKADAFVSKVGIPSPPRILLEISKEMKKSEPDLGKIGNLVKEDPALSARVVQLLNSPLYGLRTKVTSINHAVSLLGLKLFQRAVLVSALKVALSGGLDNQQFEAYWQHSVIVARAAEFIAVWLKEYEAPTDLCYMVGLFHDCARPSLMGKFPHYGDLFADGAVADGQNIRDLENAGFQTNHCVVGHLIAKSWGLDSALQDVIRYHHHEVFPSLAIGSETARKLWYVLKIAEIATAHLILKSGGCVTELPKSVAERPMDYIGDDLLLEIGMGRGELAYLLEDMADLAALGDLA